MKAYNLKMHFEKISKLTNCFLEKREHKKMEKLQKEFIAQHFMCKMSNQESQASGHASYVITYKIAKQRKPLLEGKFVKDCMLKVAEIGCRDKQRAFQNVSLSRMTITRREEEIGSDIKDQQWYAKIWTCVAGSV